VGFCGTCSPAVNLPKNHDLWAAVNLSFYEALVQWSLQGKIAL
jgi:hypothetical protein